LASGGNATGNTATGSTWEQPFIIPNGINGHSSVRLGNNINTSGQLTLGSASQTTLNVVHNTANFELMVVCRCNQATVGAAAQPQLLACSNSSSETGAAFGFYSGKWMSYASCYNTTSSSYATVWNGYSGPTYTPGTMAIYGCYGNGTNVYNYINLGSASSFSVTAGNLGSANGSPSSVRAWSFGLSAPGSILCYPFDIWQVFFWSSELSSAAQRTQFLNQINRVGHLF
jgi:hypothetical protein